MKKHVCTFKTAQYPVRLVIGIWYLTREIGVPVAAGPLSQPRPKYDRFPLLVVLAGWWFPPGTGGDALFLLNNARNASCV